MGPDASRPQLPARRRVLRLIAGCGILAGVNRNALAQSQGLLKRKIPRGGEMLPAVGVGTWQTFDVGSNAPERAELKDVLRLLVEGGGSVIDSSPMYGRAEGVVGDLSAEAGLRDKLFLATKVWTSGRDSGIRQMETSLRLMRAQRMDLMQVHNLQDVAVHAKTLREWKDAGRIRYAGITHYHAGAYAELERLVKTREWDFAQFNYSMAERDAEKRLLPLCAESGVAVVINRPFSEGSLFPRVKGRALPAWAADFDCTSWAQFFLKYILSHPAVTCAIPGTRRVAHLNDNLQAGHGRLPDEKTRRRMVEHLGI
ncbi:MAG TPA: aldo/keto reductase [Burkholderiales bacterium]|nr:aldo/keto reductase [Burkholderiales bacterium]